MEVHKEIGIIGLGRMGRGIAARLLKKGWKVMGFDIDRKARGLAEKGGVETYEEPDFLMGDFEGKRIIWIMVPHTFVDSVLAKIKNNLVEGDIVIDGGNSYYKESVRRFNELSKIGVGFLDVGVSGGVWGEKDGYCLMVGGEEKVFRNIEHLFKDLAYDGKGYGYVGRAGAGHFVKMVHNGIEYGMMEAIAEGFELMKESDYELNLEEIARLYTKGSVIRSWLIELTYKALKDFGDLSELEPYVQDSGEGRWTVQTAIESGVPLWIIANSLFTRFDSRLRNSFRNKLLAAMRHEFGGHEIKKKDG